MSTNAPFSEWRRTQFEARRDFIIALREYTELHSTFLGHIKAETIPVRHSELIKDAHEELKLFRQVLSAIDRGCN